MKLRAALYTLAVLCLLFLTFACSNADTSAIVPVHNEWCWISGSYQSGQYGFYGVKSISTDTTVPGARESAVSWVDKNGNLWLFGGYGYASDGAPGGLNDLWKFDGRAWNWMNGDPIVDQPGVYNVKSVPTSTSVPGSRASAVSWTDTDGNLWLFGGVGTDATGTFGDLNDLWKFDGNNWTWMNGDSIADQPGVYGVKGVPTDSTVPGARESAVSWIDSNGNFWLFGGLGTDSTGTFGGLNDLWEFDDGKWTWIHGDSVADQVGVYGVKSVPTTTTGPGAREFAVSWTDASGNLWLFGGYGLDSQSQSPRYLNDLWKFDGSTWTWVSGENVSDQPGIYGVKSVPSGTSCPGSRRGSVAWSDTQGNLWLFGGYGYDSAGTIGELNDLWKFDGTTWTWMKGSDITGSPGIYGQQNTISDTALPGARNGAIAWTDASGYFWLFGGSRYDTAGAIGDLNDLWVYLP